jgi:hypothetical protein
MAFNWKSCQCASQPHANEPRAAGFDSLTEDFLTKMSSQISEGMLSGFAIGRLSHRRTDAQPQYFGNIFDSPKAGNGNGANHRWTANTADMVRSTTRVNEHKSTLFSTPIQKGERALQSQVLFWPRRLQAKGVCGAACFHPHRQTQHDQP